MNIENYSSDIPASGLNEQSRGEFIARTYNHLLGAIAAFTVIEIGFFKTGVAETIARTLLGTSWLLVLVY